MVTGRERYSYGLGYGRLPFARVFRNSIMELDGEPHRRMRAILSPAVGRLALTGSQAKVQAAWTRAAEGVAHGGWVDAYEFAQQTTFDVSAHALIGLPLDRELERYRPLYAALIMGTTVFTNVRTPFGRLDRALRARKRLLALLAPRVAEARKQHEPEGMLGLLAQHRDEADRELEVEEILSHVLLLFWAGYDTTASAGSWVVHQLAHHPEWQERLREELRSTLGDGGYTLELGKKLVLLEWFLKEIERVCPSVVVFPRVLLEDVEVHGHLIPRGAAISYSPWLTHRLPDLFDEPHRFDPDRWDPARGERAAKPAHLVGFGGGPRLCLGRSFALMQLKVMIATLLLRHRIEPDFGRRFRVMGLPMHRPVASYVRFRPAE
jgi:cytochrome P450